MQGGSGCVERTEETRAWQATHFRHYAELANQQNMLEDTIRTAAYHTAITRNSADFTGRVVLDVGAGSGILSLFAAQAGAARVYAVEATSMAHHARALMAANGLSERVIVLQGALAEITLPESVDLIISEPLGVLLVHERMLEVFVAARERWLKPNGHMVPQAAVLSVAPFEDHYLHTSILNWAQFWEQSNFFGCNLTSLAATARTDALSMPMVGPMKASTLRAGPASLSVDFMHMTSRDLLHLSWPFAFTVTAASELHGLALWFDADLSGSQHQEWLKTGPEAAKTHWYQTRVLFPTPVTAAAGDDIIGHITLLANPNCSYDIRVEARHRPSHPHSDASWQLDATYALERHRYWWNG